MKKLIVIIVVVFVTNSVFISCKETKKEQKTETSSEGPKELKKDVAEYQCPMKCEKDRTYKKEGDCPVCSMKLKKKVGENQKDQKH